MNSGSISSKNILSVSQDFQGLSPCELVSRILKDKGIIDEQGLPVSKRLAISKKLETLKMLLNEPSVVENQKFFINLLNRKFKNVNDSQSEKNQLPNLIPSIPSSALKLLNFKEDHVAKIALKTDEQVKPKVMSSLDQEDDNECVICMENKIGNVLPMPCGHLLFCIECLNKIQTCAYCRAPITQIKLIKQIIK